MKEVLEELIKTNKAVVREIKGLRADMKTTKLDKVAMNLDECSSDEAVLILGYNNKRYLKYFIDQELITRRDGGRSFLYFRKELTQLAEKIKSEDVRVPKLKYLPKTKGNERKRSDDSGAGV